MFLKLFGVITPIKSFGTFSKCIPVFTNTMENSERLYKISSNGSIVSVSSLDYDFELSLPIKLPYYKYKYSICLIRYDADHNFTKKRFASYYKNGPIIIETGSSALPSKLSVGIKFPDKFVCVCSSYTIEEEELYCMLDD